MRKKRCVPWDRRIARWLHTVDWEMASVYLLLLLLGFCIGAFSVMIHFQHFMTAYFS